MMDCQTRECAQFVKFLMSLIMKLNIQNLMCAENTKFRELILIFTYHPEARAILIWETGYGTRTGIILSTHFGITTELRFIRRIKNTFSLFATPSRWCVRISN